jgi:hypothetical protein
VVIEAPGFHKLTTALYPEGDPYLTSDIVLGAKKSLVVVSMRYTPGRVRANVLLPYLSVLLVLIS